MNSPTRTRLQSFAGSTAYKPVQTWALLGVLLLAFQVYVIGSWVGGPHFVPTLPGPEPLPEWQRLYFIGLQTVVPFIALFCLWIWVARPWWRNGRLSLDGMMALSGATTVFWDPCMNYTSTTLLYNAHLINFGAWTLGSWPGWTSPEGQRLPEPILLTGTGYLALVVTQAYCICALLRWVKRRFPSLGVPGSLLAIVGGLTVSDSLIEAALIRTGVYAYPGGIRALTLFAGETYQFPLTEGFLFGGCAVGAMAALWYFVDDKGRTFVERGMEHMRIGSTGQQAVKFFAVYGFIHSAFFVLYMVPNMWLATHSDPFPQGYPAHMINGMCVYGDQRTQCPGPGVSIPRPLNNPL